MNYIEKLRLKAFLYRINCGLLFDSVTNHSNFSGLSLDDMYSKKMSSLNDSPELILINSKVDVVSNDVVVVMSYENNKLIMKEYGYK